MARTLYVWECEQEGTFKTRTYNVRAIRGFQKSVTVFWKQSTKDTFTTEQGVP
jgi:hypothetical protein